MRPINKKYFGPLTASGQQIQVTAWVPGDSQARVGFIVKQKGSYSYIVDTTAAGGLVGKCSLVNTVAGAAGEMTLAVFPFGSAQGAGATAHAVMAVNTVDFANAGLGYAVGDVLTLVGGTGTPATFTVASVDVDGVITNLVTTTPGAYTVLPGSAAVATTVSPAGGTGCTLNVDFILASLVVDNGGADYTSATVTFSSGGFAAHATIAGGVVTALVIDSNDSVIVLPTVSIVAAGSGSTEFARSLKAHQVDTFADNVYVWKLQGETIVAGQANIQSA
jgi:hypothetical protein